MNKIIRFTQNYLIVGLPFVIACMVWEAIYPNIQFVKRISISRVLWELLSYNLMAWFIVLILFLISMVTISSIREKTLRRLANLKERDEREHYITGKASRAAYISTLSVMILFLFLSLVSVKITTTPKDQTVDHHPMRVNISLGASLLNKYGSENNANSQHGEDKILFDSEEFSLSSSAMILFLLSWQLLVFNYTARKEQMKDVG